MTTRPVIISRPNSSEVRLVSTATDSGDVFVVGEVRKSLGLGWSFVTLGYVRGGAKTMRAAAEACVAAAR